MSENKVPIDQIAKLADDVRLIKDFAENHNFDNSFLTASVVPSKSSKSHDMPLIVMIVSMLSVLACAGFILFWNPPLSKAMNNFIILIGLLFTTSATMSAHLKFKENVITGAVAIGLIMLLFIGAGIFTPKEALDKAGELAK